MMRFWLDKGVTGFRLDVINLISKDQCFLNDEGSTATSDGRKYYTDGPRVHEYLQEMNRNVFAHIKLQLKVIALEAPRDNLYKMDERKKLNKELSTQLTKEAKKITKKLQKANCDAFGIGRHLIAYHPDLWKKKNWNKDYAKVKFKPEVEVNILYSGVLK